MRRLLLLLPLSLVMAGCQSISYPLPSCDGYSKRPLNRSMWDWPAQGLNDPAIAVAPSAASATDPSGKPLPLFPVHRTYGAAHAVSCVG